MKTILDELNEVLVNTGKYPNREELIKDALRALIRSKPELKKDVAIELYRKKEVSLSRAAEISGLNIEDFKEILKERGVKISLSHVSREELNEELESILEMV